MPPLTRCKRLRSTRSEGPTEALQTLRFDLLVETTHPRLSGPLLNRFESPTSTVASLRAGVLQRYDRRRNEFVELTAQEREEEGYVGEVLTLVSTQTRLVFRNAGGVFSVGEVVRAIEEFERADRPKTTWFGGIDCHHTFFEGLAPNEAGDAFFVRWAS
jgi:hypothetical protein